MCPACNGTTGGSQTPYSCMDHTMHQYCTACLQHLSMLATSPTPYLVPTCPPPPASPHLLQEGDGLSPTAIREILLLRELRHEHIVELTQVQT